MYDGVLVYSRFANLTNTTNNGSKIFNAARNSVTLGVFIFVLLGKNIGRQTATRIHEQKMIER